MPVSSNKLNMPKIVKITPINGLEDQTTEQIAKSSAPTNPSIKSLKIVNKQPIFFSWNILATNPRQK